MENVNVGNIIKLNGLSIKCCQFAFIPLNFYTLDKNFTQQKCQGDNIDRRYWVNATTAAD